MSINITILTLKRLHNEYVTIIHTSLFFSFVQFSEKVLQFIKSLTESRNEFLTTGITAKTLELKLHINATLDKYYCLYLTVITAKIEVGNNCLPHISS